MSDHLRVSLEIARIRKVDYSNVVSQIHKGVRTFTHKGFGTKFLELPEDMSRVELGPYEFVHLESNQPFRIWVNGSQDSFQTMIFMARFEDLTVEIASVSEQIQKVELVFAQF